MSASGNAAIRCVLEFIHALEREVGRRPSEITLDDKVFDILTEGVLSLDPNGIKQLGLAPSARFSITRSVLPRCESVFFMGVKVSRHSGGRDAPR